MTGHLPLGRVVATSGALKVLREAGEDPLRYLARHASGDWGNLDAHDRRENERSLKYGWRVLSSYPVGNKRAGSLPRPIGRPPPSSFPRSIDMPCAFCGEGDEWIKTCRAKGDSRLCVCDLCWETLTPWLVLVPGDTVVTARCDGCGAHFNPREMAKFSPGGRHNAYSGTCEGCAEVSAGVKSEVPNSVA